MPGPRERPRILVLGGTGDGLALARELALLGYPLVYSVRGLARVPRESFVVRSGGFGGVEGLAHYLVEKGIGLVLDATHPYADTISSHVITAARGLDLPCWALRRPLWLPGPGDDWREVIDWRELMRLLEPFRRPLFSIGREPLERASDRSSHQVWLVRSLDHELAPEGVILITARGPFTLEQELQLLRRHHADALVSKNSGGEAVSAKLHAARELEIPVFMLGRPTLSRADREFQTIDSVVVALERDAKVH